MDDRVMSCGTASNQIHECFCPPISRFVSWLWISSIVWRNRQKVWYAFILIRESRIPYFLTISSVWYSGTFWSTRFPHVWQIHKCFRLSSSTFRTFRNVCTYSGRLNWSIAIRVPIGACASPRKPRRCTQKFASPFRAFPPKIRSQQNVMPMLLFPRRTDIFSSESARWNNPRSVAEVCVAFCPKMNYSLEIICAGFYFGPRWKVIWNEYWKSFRQ